MHHSAVSPRSNAVSSAVAHRSVEAVLGRAQTYLRDGQYSRAIGAFRAAIAVTPAMFVAQVGLADALVGGGRRTEAIEGLVSAAKTLREDQQQPDALGLLNTAFALDPSRVGLHLDIAVVEEAMGQHELAVERVEGLADHYMDQGRTDEAAELLRLSATWGATVDPMPSPQPDNAVAPPPPPDNTVDPPPPPAIVRPAAVVIPIDAPPSVDLVSVDRAPFHQAIITGRTVVARNPLLPATDLPDAADNAILTPTPKPSSPPVEPIHAVDDAILTPTPRPSSPPVEPMLAADSAIDNAITRVVALPDIVEVITIPEPAKVAAAATPPPVPPRYAAPKDVDDMVTRIARAPSPPRAPAAKIQRTTTPRRGPPPPPQPRRRASNIGPAPAVVERLRAGASSRSPRMAVLRKTESFAVRRPLGSGRMDRSDDDMTVRYRRPAAFESTV